jgi:hypothetical protein
MSTRAQDGITRRLLIMLTAIATAVVLVIPTAGAETSESVSEVGSVEPWSQPGPGWVAYETGARGEATYIVRHQAPSLAQYRGGIEGLAPTNPDAIGQVRLDPNSAASVAYRAYLAELHDTLLASIEAELGRDVTVVYRYDAVYNGIAVRMTGAEAKKVSALPGVRRVARDYARHIQTDNGPAWIGADAVHDGSSAPGGVGTMGEGIVAGIIDTGINTDHPSFADIGPVDGYDHTNPRGTYLGLCDPVTGLPFCNDKLIGVYDFTTTTPEDGIGHGSHTASTVAGNFVAAEMVGPTITLQRDIGGVAPHANIISYKACQEITGNCLISGILGSINAATLDQVDVINYSIGGGSVNPWTDDDAQAFFDASAAGIFVATSAGNEGPGAATLGSPADAPWVTSVGASTHDRKIANGLVDMTGPGSPPADVFGKGITTGYGPARIVYAGDFAAQSNDPANAHLCGSGVGDPATGEGSGGQPWPAGTFDGEIVVCDRGEYGRVHKGENVLAAGAGGYILANDEANGDSLTADAHALPGVHISYEDGLVLKAWIAANGGAAHTGTGVITGMDPGESAASGDSMAGFSSRGPNPSAPGLVKPDVTAPGVDILAAYHTPAGTLPGGAPEFNIISGTSMSSPHTAGAGALIRAMHPDWSPDQVKSALMTVAFDELPGTGREVHGVFKEDGVTPADPFDMGSGRVDLRLSGFVGFTLDETSANYEAADPALGGDARTLNIASLGDHFCATTCTWTRTLIGTAPGTVNWTTSSTTAAGMTLTVSPASFSLSEGEQVTLTITADVGGVTPKNEWAFAEIAFAPDDSSVPAAHFPVAVKPYGGPPPVQLYMHGNVHDDCIGNGATDLVIGEGVCTPHLSGDAVDTAPAASWGPIAWTHDCTVDRCISDPNWIWDLDQATTVQGPMTVGWWFGGPAVNTGIYDDFEIRLYADGVEVLRTEVRHNVTAPNVPEFLQSVVNVPKTTASDNFVLVIDPVNPTAEGAFIWYDSDSTCPGAREGTKCMTSVLMPVTDNSAAPPIANDDEAFALNGGTTEIDVLANDDDPEGGPLGIEIITAPANGDAEVTLANTISYTHDGTETTSDSLEYRITDNQGLTDTATVSITIASSCFVPAGSYSDDFESGAPGWTVDTKLNTAPSMTWQLFSPDPFATSGTTVWYTDANAGDASGPTTKDVRLVSPEQLGSNSTHLTFWHRYNTELGFDGGVLEVSTDGGASWQDVLDAGGVFVSGGYTDLLSPGSGFALSGRAAWGGESSGFATGDMVPVEVDLGALAGQTFQVRFRFGQDELVPEPAGGWWIDDVAFSDLLEECSDEPQPPVAEDDSDTVAAGGSVNTDVKANDSDPDTDAADLAVTIETAPSNGDAVVEADGTVTYTHDGGTATTDSYQYRITDPDGGFDVATVTITIEHDNQPPVANDDTATVDQGGSTTVDVKANDSDPDNTSDELTVTIETQPINGTAGVTGDGEIVYTHDGSDTTDDAFRYRITDPHGEFSTATVFVTIEPDTRATIGRAHGSGWWDRDGKGAEAKVHFSFDSLGSEGNGGEGRLRVNDTAAGVTIDADDVTDVTNGDGDDCNGTVLDGDGTFSFLAEGKYEDGDGTVDDAVFRACGDDTGDPGKDGDTFFVECMTGCDYDTGSNVLDDGIDGGNVHVIDKDRGSVGNTERGGATTSDGATTNSESPEAGLAVIDLDPMFLDTVPAGTPLVLTAVAWAKPGAEVEGVEITLRWTDKRGTEHEATAIADALGVAVFTVIVPAGEVEFIAWVGELSSNGIPLTGTRL